MISTQFQESPNPTITRPIAVGALLTTVTACTLIVIQSALDYSGREKEVTYSSPTIMGTFKAFGSVMYAYAGASTFPTIQADMKKREKFNIAAVSACVSTFPNKMLLKQYLQF